jgi:hypothetical protein
MPWLKQLRFARISGIIALRHQGWKFRDIGLVYGISASYASELFRVRRFHRDPAVKLPNRRK